MDLAKKIDDIKEQWDKFNMMKPKRPLGATTVAAFAVASLCDNPQCANLLIVYPDKDDILFADLKVRVMKHYWAYVRRSQTPEPSRGHALAVQYLGGAFVMALGSPGQPLLY